MGKDHCAAGSKGSDNCDKSIAVLAQGLIHSAKNGQENMYIDRVKLRNILLQKETTDLLGILWSTLCENDKRILVERILDAGNFELAIALNDNLGWKCPLD